MSPGLHRPVAFVLAIVLCLTTAPAWAAREISCESHKMRRQFCPTGAHGAVRLLESKGFWPCEEGRTWGVETDGIWVDNECKGRFWVEDRGGSHGNRNAAIAAGVIGALVLGAAMANNKNSNDRGAEERHHEPRDDREVPGWAIGRYHGYDPDARIEVTLDVSPSGRTVFGARGRDSYGRFIAHDLVALDDGQRLRVERTDRGLRTVSERDRSRITEFYRDR